MTVSTASHEIALNAIADSINVGGAAYEIWAQRFSEACDGYFDSIDSDQRSAAVEIATKLGYFDPSDDVEYDPNVCSRSGIDNAYCHCGYHE